MKNAALLWTVLAVLVLVFAPLLYALLLLPPAPPPVPVVPQKNAVAAPSSSCSSCPSSSSSSREGFRQAISMANTTNTALALIDTVVKASFHSAYRATDNTVSLEQLRVVLGRGVRWLDFDVLSIDAQPMVGFTTKPVAAPPVNTGMAAVMTNATGDPPNAAGNALPLTSVLVEAASAAFNGDTSPNSGDPLFVNLRIKTNDSSVYPTIAAAFGNAFGSALYSSRLLPHRTPLAALTGRVVFVLDTLHSAPGFRGPCDNSYSSCAAVQQVRSLAGLLCGTAAFPLTTAAVQARSSFSPVMPGDPGADLARTVALSRTLAAAANTRRSDTVDGFTAARRRGGLPGRPGAMLPSRLGAAAAAATAPPPGVLANPTSAAVERDTTATRWRCTVPDIAAPANGDVVSLIAHWGIQVAPQCFWRDDDALAAYESLFQENGGAAFLALSSAIGAAVGSGGAGTAAE